MARQLRLDAPGMTHHITARGNERKKIFRDDADCLKFLELLAEAVRRFGWVLHTYVLMVNHYHLVLTTPQATLSEGMQWLNGKYAQWFNKRHRRSGHLFQGRFHSFLVDSEAQRIFRQYVNEKIGDTGSIWDEVVGQIYLGRQEWVEKMRVLVESAPRSDDHPRAQRLIGRPAVQKVISAVAEVFGIDREDLQHGRGGAPRMLAAWLARYEGGSRLRAIAASLRLRSSGHISNMVAACERELCRDGLLRSLVDRCLELLRGGQPGERANPALTAPLLWPMVPLPDQIREAPPPYFA